MRTIKFRGVKVSDGEYVYGDLSHDHGHIFINDKRVKPESVAQLIGYDRYDNEVYEGDIILEAGKYRSTVPHMTLYKYYNATVE